MGYSEIIVWSLAGFLVAVTFLNPAGLIVGGTLAILLLGAYYGIPWVGDLIKTRQQGKSAAKADRSVRKKLRGGEK